MTILAFASTIDYLDQLLADAEAMKYESAARILDLAAEIIDLAQQMGDFRRFADGLIHQARANMMLTRYEAALTSAMEALLLARQHNYSETEANAVGTLGVTLGACGLHEEARLLLEQQLRLAEQQHNREFQAMALNNLALLSMGTARARVAGAMLERALIIVPADSHAGLDRASILHNLSMMWSTDGRYREAVAAAHEGLRLAEDAGCTPMITTFHLGLAGVHLVAEALELSATHLDQARMHLGDEYFSPNHIKIELATGNFLAAQGLFTDAIEVLERAYDLSIHHHMLDMAVSSLHAIREMHERLDDMLGVVVAYRRLTEDIVQQQQHYGNLRLRVLAMVFAQDMVSAQADLHQARRKQAMLQNLPAEFATPLSVIRLSAQLVDKQADRMPLEQRRRHLQIITAQVQEMSTTLENVSHLLSDDEPTRPMLPARQFSLSTLMFLTIENLEDGLSDRVRVNISEEDSAVRVAVDALQPVLWHLLTNALKFSEDEVELDIRAYSSKLVMRVSDSGIGVPTAEQRLIFQPMVRASNNDSAGGAGLGLAVVTKMVDQLHGDIDLISTEGEGTTVTVRVPL